MGQTVHAIPTYGSCGSRRRPAPALLRSGLRRYNGKSHRHTNPIEGVTFYDYHIHMATERYQGIGADEDTYAEATTKYSNYSEAFELMLKEGNFVEPPTDQTGLFL